MPAFTPATPLIDNEVFEQLVELDEEGSTEFLEGVIQDWYDQARDTFKDMDEALASKNLLEFSKRAHFLKGSSGQLGVQRLQATCSTLQHYGELWDPSTSSEKTRNLSEQEATERIKPLVKRARGEYKEARRWLNDYLRSRGAQVEEEKEEEEDKDEKEDEKEKETKAAPTPATPAVAAAKPTGAQAAPKTEQPKVKEPEKAKPNGMKAPASPKVARKEKA